MREDKGIAQGNRSRKECVISIHSSLSSVALLLSASWRWKEYLEIRVNFPVLFLEWWLGRQEAASLLFSLQRWLRPQGGKKEEEVDKGEQKGNFLLIAPSLSLHKGHRPRTPVMR